jgi:drug/metabolite transporter (DMT)-like permease
MVLAMGVFIASDTCMKLALPHMPFFELALMKGYASVVLCLILVVLMGQGKHLMMMFNPWLIVRGLCEVVANFAFTLAIVHMPLADVTAIAQTCPLLVLLGARLIWGERLGGVRLALIGLGLSGAMLVAQPGTTAASPYAVLGFLVAASAAIRDLITRKVPTDIPAPVVAFTVLVTYTIASAACMMLFETPVLPEWRYAGLTTLAGALIIGGHIGIYLAYKIGPARSVAPFMYTVTLWAVFFGIVLFNDFPNSFTIAGMALIVTAGLAIILLDTRRRPLLAVEAAV